MTVLIFLHGAPASGKLTVAKALLRALPGRLFDNHSAIDLARTVFDFGVPGFWDLVQTVRMAALDAAALHGVPLVVTTFCYSEPEDRSLFEQFEAVLAKHGGEVLPVFLHCSDEEAKRRVGNTDRVERRKLTSVEGLAGFTERWNIAPVPRTNCLMLDTEIEGPDLVASSIIRHFGLDARAMGSPADMRRGDSHAP
jgi:hypothetical protein